MMTYPNDGWSAIAEPMRRAILERLVEQPCSVGDIASALPISRPAVSQHLKILKQVGLVVDTPAGKHRIYRIDPKGLEALRAELDSFWSKTLAAYKVAVEEPSEK